jgi:hypothetical protein
MKIFSKITIATLLASCILPAWADNNDSTDTSSTTVPLQVVPMGGNDYKVGISVSVAGGPPSQVTFDTGGVGLHIFASQVGNQNITYTKRHIRSSFGSAAGGFIFEGVVAYAPVTIGGVTTQPIPVLVIQNVTCYGQGKCNFDTSGDQPPMFGQFYGELGAGMGTEKEGKTILTSPLRALPGNYGSGFIIENLSAGGEGQLVIGLNSQNTAGYNMVQLPQEGNLPDGTPYYDDKSLMVQYNLGNFSKAMRTAFDTGGNANVNFFTDDTSQIRIRRGHVARGQNFSASYNNAFNWQFTTGNKEGVNLVRMMPASEQKGEYVNTGLLFFFSNNVLYNFQQGMLGFAPQN